MSIDSEISKSEEAEKSEISRKRLLLLVAIVAILVGSIIFFVFIFTGPPNWVNVGSWAGEETEYTMTTGQFTINGTDWHINWQAVGYNSSARCYVSVYDADTNELIVDLPHQQSGMADFNTLGTFYLKIETHGALKSWAVQVYQTP